MSDAKSPEPPKTFDGFDVVESWYFRTPDELLNSKDFYRIHSETEKREYLRKISTNFKKVDYCPYKPKTQIMNSEEVEKVYQSLDLNKLVTECIQKMEKIKII